MVRYYGMVNATAYLPGIPAYGKASGASSEWQEKERGRSALLRTRGLEPGAAQAAYERERPTSVNGLRAWALRTAIETAFRARLSVQFEVSQLYTTDTVRQWSGR